LEWENLWRLGTWYVSLGVFDIKVLTLCTDTPGQIVHTKQEAAWNF